MSLGTLVTDEVILPVTAVELVDGTIRVTATGRVSKKTTLQAGDQVRIHGRDGKAVAVLALILAEPVTADPGPDGKPAWLTVIQPLGITEFVGKAAWPPVPA
jgi:thiamine monophosphate kinase